MSGNNLMTKTTNARWFQLFRYKKGFVTNERGKVMDVQSALDHQGRNIIMHKKHGGRNQQWDIVYTDAMPPEPKKCEMNKDFGFKVDCDFHIVSKMKSAKYIDRVGNNVVLKTPNARQTQLWYFHQKSRTIRSRYQNYSFNIQSNGRSNNLAVTTTNSNWW
jgi:hypothetical protein